MAWRVFSLETRSGQVGMELPSASLGGWTIPLSGVETASVTVAWDDMADGIPGFGSLPKHIRSTLTGGIVLAYESTSQPLTPIIAGPITSAPTCDADGMVQINFSGLRHLFKGRFVFDSDPRPDEHMTTGVVHLSGVSLGSIAWRLAQMSMLRRGGDLPLVHGQSDEPAHRERTYENWNIANNQIDKRWTEISEVINGPEISAESIVSIIAAEASESGEVLEEQAGDLVVQEGTES